MVFLVAGWLDSLDEAIKRIKFHYSHKELFGSVMYRPIKLDVDVVLIGNLI